MNPEIEKRRKSQLSIFLTPEETIEAAQTAAEVGKKRKRQLSILLALIGVAIVVCVTVGFRSCMGKIARILPVEPEVGDTVRLVCKNPEWAGTWIEHENIVLVDQIDPLGGRVGTIPCGTVVTIRNIHEGIHGGNESYYVVPLDTELPSGWLSFLVVEDFIEFEQYEE